MDDHLTAFDNSYPGNDPRAVDLLVIHALGGQGSYLKKGGIPVKQKFQAFSDRQFVLLGQSGPGLF